MAVAQKSVTAFLTESSKSLVKVAKSNK